MRVSVEPESFFEFVFTPNRELLPVELREFWLKHRSFYQQEIRSFRLGRNHLGHFPLLSIPLSTQPAAVARDARGKIVGMVLVALRELNLEMGHGSHAYFQRMYVIPKARSARLSSGLLKFFLEGFDGASAYRDPRAATLMAENVNPRLHNMYSRRYFSRLGFRMLGLNDSGSEIWVKDLETRFIF